MDTIVALSTPIGRSGVAVIRISGAEAHAQLDRIFVRSSSASASSISTNNTSDRATNNTSDVSVCDTSVNKREHRLMSYGKVVCKEFYDNVLAVKFFSPHSYTGEHTAEIHCHGSPVIYGGIVAELIHNGCRMAERGEFTQRALLNNKLDLLQAEGINDVIHADTVAQVVQSNTLVDGMLSLKVAELETTLLNCVASIEVALDYPEEDLELETQAQLKARLSTVLGVVDAMLADYNHSRLIRDGVKVVLVGVPNAGKSSLLNAMLGYERAIVDSTAGTTRDVVQDSYVYDNIKFILSDTAGLRDTEDRIEHQGVQRAMVQVEDADVLICLDQNFEKDARAILVDNKSDLRDTILHDDRLHISAKTGYNIDKLKQQVYNKSIQKPQNTTAINNLRQYNAMQQARTSIALALSELYNTTLDCIAIDVRHAWESIKSLTGQAMTDDILATIFSQFCVGK